MLIDLCSTRRGKKTGLETRLREKAPNLLDIDGDSVHHAHNVAKSCTAPFNCYLEGLLNSIHANNYYRTYPKDELKGTCSIQDLTYTKPERYTSHGFLSAHKLAVDTNRLFDAYTLMYFAFFDKTEKPKLQKLIDIILVKHKVSEKGRVKMDVSHKKIAKKTRTKDGKARKERIIGKLFDDYAIGHIHKTEFLGYFMKPQSVPKTSRKLKQIELSDILFMPKSDMLAEKNCDKKGDQRLCREGSYK